MKNEELMKYIKAEDEGKIIEQCRMGRHEWKKKNPDEDWDACHYKYRIAEEQGKWVRKVINKGVKEYTYDHHNIDALQRFPGFGGIEYKDPRHNITVVSMCPVYFDKSGGCHTVVVSSAIESMIPGIPIAAYFWEE